MCTNENNKQFETESSTGVGCLHLSPIPGFKIVVNYIKIVIKYINLIRPEIESQKELFAQAY